MQRKKTTLLKIILQSSILTRRVVRSNRFSGFTTKVVTTNPAELLELA
jgi:hypothetical protein